jgi:hypothetical protein
MAPLLAMAIPSLVKLLPDVAGWFGGDKAEEMTSEVLDIASSVTGISDKNKALEAINADPNIALKFQEAVMKDRHRLDEMYLQEKQSARNNYVQSKDQADEMADFIMKWNLVLIGIIFVAQIFGTWWFKDEATLVAMINSMSTLILKSLLDERKEVNGFYFGSSLGSKLKDKQNKGN